MLRKIFLISLVSIPTLSFAGAPGPEEGDNKVQYHDTFYYDSGRKKYYQLSNADGSLSPKTAKEQKILEEKKSFYKKMAEKMKEDSEQQQKEMTKKLNSVTPLPEMKQNRWVVNKGESLKGLVTRWCKKEGWNPVWDAQLDQTMSATKVIKGDFKHAIVELFQTLQSNGSTYVLDLWKGNSVVRVTMINSGQTSEMEN